MKIIDRYVLREFIIPFSFGLAVFLTIFLVDVVMELIEWVIVKGVSINMVLKLLIYSIPKLYVIVCPMSLLFSSLLTFGKFSTDSEIIAMKAGGFSFQRIITPIVIVGLLFTGVNIWINEVVVPKSNMLRKRVIKKISIVKPLPKIAEKVFFEAGSERTFYIGKYNQTTGKMIDVTMFEFPKTFNEYPKIIQSKTAVWKKGIWTFEDGVIKEYTKSGKENFILEFKKYVLPVKLNYVPYVETKYKEPKEMSIKELLVKIRKYKKKKIATKDLELELNNKFSFPVASLVFILIGAPLALKPTRSGSSIGMGLSIVIIFFYYILLALGKALGQAKILNVFFSAWLPNIVIGIIGLILIYRARK